MPSGRSSRRFLLPRHPHLLGCARFSETGASLQNSAAAPRFRDANERCVFCVRSRNGPCLTPSGPTPAADFSHCLPPKSLAHSQSARSVSPFDSNGNRPFRKRFVAFRTFTMTWFALTLMKASRAIQAPVSTASLRTASSAIFSLPAACRSMSS
jgi:hypothetical protein